MQDGEVDEEEFMKLVWLSLGEQPPDIDPQNGDQGPQTSPFLSISHSTKSSGEETLEVLFARLELDLSLEPLGM
eukprot:1254989-Rhodomonas_salina.2